MLMGGVKKFGSIVLITIMLHVSKSKVQLFSHFPVRQLWGVNGISENVLLRIQSQILHFEATAND